MHGVKETIAGYLRLRLSLDAFVRQKCRMQLLSTRRSYRARPLPDDPGQRAQTRRMQQAQALTGQVLPDRAMLSIKMRLKQAQEGGRQAVVLHPQNPHKTEQLMQVGCVIPTDQSGM